MLCAELRLLVFFCLVGAAGGPDYWATPALATGCRSAMLCDARRPPTATPSPPCTPCPPPTFWEQYGNGKGQAVARVYTRSSVGALEVPISALHPPVSAALAMPPAFLPRPLPLGMPMCPAPPSAHPYVRAMPVTNAAGRGGFRPRVYTSPSYPPAGVSNCVGPLREVGCAAQVQSH